MTSRPEVEQPDVLITKMVSVRSSYTACVFLKIDNKTENCSQ